MMAWIRVLEPPKWLQHCDDGRRYGHMTTNFFECINSVLKGTRNLLKAILANREGNSQMLMTSYDRLTSIFIVDEITTVGVQSRFRVYLEHRRCDSSYFQALHYPVLMLCLHAHLQDLTGSNM
ncbi:hypothetical protein AHAS_Ahas02G0113600 [Arachis hypogaea]